MSGTSLDDGTSAWSEVRLAPRPPSIAAARRHVRDVLVESNRSDLVDTCALLVSEVVTNAMLHAGTDIDLRVRLGEAGVHVEVDDGSPHLPSRRRYAATAGTGRGLLMLEALVEDWGVVRRQEGKTVWFVLSGHAEGLPDHPSPEGGQATGSRQLRRRTDTVAVELRNLPQLLHAAWQEQAEALLREYLLASLDSDGQYPDGMGPDGVDRDSDPIQQHAEATDAIAVLEEHLPRSPLRIIPDVVMTGHVEPLVTVPVVDLPVPRGSLPHFETLDRVLDAAQAFAEEGVVLTPPTQPELRAFRHWVCSEVRRQSRGEAPLPWVVPEDSRGEARPPAGWDPDTVTRSEQGVIAADSASQILAVSGEAARILGYADPADLVGRRLVSIVPERFRQAHVAGFTMYQLAGRAPLLELSVTVPALCRDGSEVDVELGIRDLTVGDGDTVLLAAIRPAHGSGSR